MKYIFLALLFLNACKNSTLENKVPSAVDPIATASPTITPNGGIVTTGLIHFIPDANHTTSEQRKLIASVEAKANEVKNSDCVHSFLSARKMIQTDGKTYLQVANEVRAASGNIPVKFYYTRFGSAVAYREPPSLTIHLNSRFYGSWSTVCEVVSVLLHESVGHSLLNFDHDYKWSASREYSVPYSINHAVDTGSYSMSDSGGCCK